MDEEGFQSLRAAVVRRALWEYGQLKKHMKNSAERSIEMSNLLRWFHSQAFSFWCSSDPDSLLRQIDKNVEKGYIFIPEENNHSQKEQAL